MTPEAPPGYVLAPTGDHVTARKMRLTNKRPDAYVGWVNEIGQWCSINHNKHAIRAKHGDTMPLFGGGRVTIKVISKK